MALIYGIFIVKDHKPNHILSFQQEKEYSINPLNADATFHPTQ